MNTDTRLRAYAALAALAFLATGFGCTGRKPADKSSEQAAVAETTPNLPQAANELTAKEKNEGWKLLFDGKTLDGWIGTGKEKIPGENWVVKDGVLSMEPGEDGHSGGDIITAARYDDFELSLEVKIPEGANSGIKYFVVDNYPGYEGSFLGLEYQVLDDERHPDARNGVNGNRTAASLYDLIPARNKKMIIGEWNNVRIVARGNHAEHWLNGRKVVEFERGSKEFKSLVAKSKYKPYKNFGEASQGHILLQGHGDPVHFRNIKIRELPE